ncbi:MAG: hypothetical protein LBP75_10800 [Planctomycetota bacterium]|nr:hypothetical protein [Planctomycetota bacterium]
MKNLEESKKILRSGGKIAEQLTPHGVNDVCVNSNKEAGRRGKFTASRLAGKNAPARLGWSSVPNLGSEVERLVNGTIVYPFTPSRKSEIFDYKTN